MPIDINITSEHVKSATILAHFINSLEALDLVDEIDEQWIMQAILAIRLTYMEQKTEQILVLMKREAK
jgi:hypothetical protein